MGRKKALITGASRGIGTACAGVGGVALGGTGGSSDRCGVVVA